MDENLLIIIIFILVGIMEIILGIPLIYKKIKPNWFYGFRLPETVSNKEIWYKVNKQTGKDFVISGFILIITSLILLILIRSIDIITITMIQTIVLLVTITAIIARGLALLKKL
jgi:uncharacterized membrane protein